MVNPHIVVHIKGKTLHKMKYIKLEIKFKTKGKRVGKWIDRWFHFLCIFCHRCCFPGRVLGITCQSTDQQKGWRLLVLSQTDYLSPQKGFSISAQSLLVSSFSWIAQPLWCHPRRCWNFKRAWRRTMIYLNVSVLMFLEPTILPGFMWKYL